MFKFPTQSVTVAAGQSGRIGFITLTLVEETSRLLGGGGGLKAGADRKFQSDFTSLSHLSVLSRFFKRGEEGE